jgi:hypothetical protein
VITWLSRLTTDKQANRLRLPREPKAPHDDHDDTWHVSGLVRLSDTDFLASCSS